MSSQIGNGTADRSSTRDDQVHVVVHVKVHVNDYDYVNDRSSLVRDDARGERIDVGRSCS